MKRFKYLFFVLMFAISLVILNLSLTLAKYVTNITWNYYLESKGFYFTSDILNNSATEDSSWNDEEIYFNLKNYLNNDISNYTIEYELECNTNDENVSCLFENEENKLEGTLNYTKKCFDDVNEEDVSEYKKGECEDKGYTYRSEKTNKDIYVTLVSVENYVFDKVVVDITAKSIAPYKKELSETFIIHNSLKEESEISLNVLTSDDFVYLNITNNKDDKCVNLSFNSDDLNIVNDNYDVINTKDDFINEISFELKKEKELMFYIKNKNINYTSNDFVLDECD